MSLGIESKPIPLAASSDGVVRVAGTRVTLDTVVTAFLEGATAEEIVQQYPALQRADVYSVIGHYLRWRSEMDAYLRRRRQQTRALQADMETRFDPAGIRERLLARQERWGE